MNDLIEKYILVIGDEGLEERSVGVLTKRIGSISKTKLKKAFAKRIKRGKKEIEISPKLTDAERDKIIAAQRRKEYDDAQKYIAVATKRMAAKRSKDTTASKIYPN